jgi:hypothetical protein
MTFPVVGSNVPLPYEISNSLRFNDNDSAYLNRTPSSASNRQTWTWSAWIKRSAISTGNYQTMWNAGSSAADDIRLTITNNDEIIFGTDATIFFLTSQRLRDISAWYHIVFAFDTTQGTASNRAKLYINGSLVTNFSTDNRSSLSGSYAWNNTVGHGIGRQALGGSAYFDGYMAEINFIDGQALSPTDFGKSDSNSGVWKPKQYEGTYGTNGFYLKFNNTGNMGEDSSGNDNTWTPTNLSGTTDVTTDTPTNNFATLNPLNIGDFNTTYGATTFANGNLQFKVPYVGQVTSTFGVNTGKWYIEVYNASDNKGVGFAKASTPQTNGYYNTAMDASIAMGAVAAANDIFSVKVDFDAGTAEYAINNGSYTSLAGSLIIGETYTFSIGRWSGTGGGWDYVNFGQDSSFSGNTARQNNTDSKGYGDFYYAPPSGYLALCTQNLATALSPTIDDGSQYFNTVLWTGNATDDRSITGVGFAPDFVWTKERSSTSSHVVHDTTRGATYTLIPNQNASESVQADILKAFESDGFQIGTSGAINENSQTYVGWNWKANGGTTSSNTDGTKTTTVQTSQTSGFSIVTYNGLTNGQTIGHGLGATPEMIIFKRRDAVGSWHTWHQGLGDGYNYIYLNSTSAKQNDAYEYISNIGSSTVQLQGSTDGTFVYTGFRPAFVLIKRTTGTEDWIIYDSVRDTFNAVDSFLKPNISDAEGTASYGDLLSNGFKARNTFAPLNASGEPHIYMAFAENPFVTSGGVPVTAR